MQDLDQDPLPSRLRQLITDQFRIELSGSDEFSDHEPLFGGRLGLDSLDALELAMSVEEEFGITIPSREESLSAFASITSLAGYIQTHAPTGARLAAARAAAA